MEIEEVAADEGRGEEDRVVAMVHHIVRSVITSENMRKDMATMLSTFDNRPSAMTYQSPANLPGASADLETNLASADRIISCWDSKSSKTMLFQSSRKEANEYLAAVDGLRHLMENLIVTHRSSPKLVRAQRLMEMSMARLEKEFRRILSANVKPTMTPDDGDWSHGSSDNWSMDEGGSGSDPRGSWNSNADEICEIDMIPLNAVQDLRSIAKRMVAGGYGNECVRIYGLIRKPVIEGCLNRIGVDRLSTSDVQKIEWEILDFKIKNWIRSVRIAVRILFASEKRLCDEIFAGLNNVRDSCFAEVVKEPMKILLAFGESVAMGKKSSEMLFRMLDMYETLWDLMPDIETVYCQESCASVRTQASTIFVRLGDTALGTITVFDNAIQAENSKIPVQGGTIHPLTGYVMNYLSFLSDYKETLMNITANSPNDGHDDELRSRASADLSARLGWIIINLQCNLDSKSNLYKDAALSNLFLMSNLDYIVNKVKGSRLLGILGYGWLRKNQSEVRQYAENYERAAWTKALNCLKDERSRVSVGVSSGASQQALEDRFSGFNCEIEEVLKKHSGWMVPDVQLQEELRISIAEKMIPAYRSFLGRLRKYSESGRHFQIHMKYTPEDLEARLFDLFQGNPSSHCSGRS